VGEGCESAGSAVRKPAPAAAAKASRAMVVQSVAGRRAEGGTATAYRKTAGNPMGPERKNLVGWFLVCSV
jgi:hypothetical protein